MQLTSDNISRRTFHSERIPISVVIPTKDEETNLPNCLNALADYFEEIIVVDSGSADRTRDIAQEHGVKILPFQWDGRYPKKRNWVLINNKFVTNWVLFLDADEIVTKEFIFEVSQAIIDETVNGFWLNYTNIFLGRELKYGISQRKLSLFRINAGLYEYIEENNWTPLDMEIHEHPIINGRLGEIRSHIVHRDYRGIRRFIERHCDYARWEANRLASLRKSSRWSNLTKRQIFKYNYLASWWFPYFYFLFAYFIRRGFLDGSAGFYYAFYKMWYFVTVRRLIMEINKCS